MPWKHTLSLPHQTSHETVHQNASSAKRKTKTINISVYLDSHTQLSITRSLGAAKWMLPRL